MINDLFFNRKRVTRSHISCSRHLSARERFRLLFTIAVASFSAGTAANGTEHLFVVGDATWGGWSLDKTSVMIRDAAAPDIFRYTGWLEADKEFKFLAQTAWDREEYRNLSRDPYTISDLAYSDNGSVPDYKFKVSESANYTVTCDLSTMKISVEKSDYTEAPIFHNELYLVGDATPGGWTLSEALPVRQDHTDPMHFSAGVMLKPGIFKIATNPYGGYNEQKFYFRDPADEGRITEDGTDDRQWSITAAGYYTVDIDLKASTISITQGGPREILGACLGWSREGKAVVINAENGTLTLTPYNDYVVKVFPHMHTDATPERRSISVSAQPEGTFSVEELADRIVLSTAATVVTVSRTDCRIDFSDISGRQILQEDMGLDNSMQPRTATFRGMDDAAFYGGGYNGKRIDHNGTILTMNNRQTGGWDSSWDAPHNICIPFVVSASGYGLLFDDHYRNARLSPSAEGTTYTTNSPSPIAYYYVGSADGGMASVLENYTFLTGRQELPPYWALGYMTSRYGYRSQQEAEEAVESVKNSGLPLDAIVFDLYWQGAGNNGMGNLDWYTPNFPDAGGMMSRFAAKGVKTVCITEPFFTSDSRNYSELKEKGFLADDNVSRMEWLGSDKVGLIDSSNPQAMDWMWQFYKVRTQEGVGGWWLDLGEPESHDDDSRHMGGTVGEVHNEFGDLWTARVYRGFREDFPDVRPFLMPRAGTAGMQRYSAFPWSGDIMRSFAGLDAQIPALLSSGMSGVAYMGSDVGGFKAENVGTHPQLYLRWVEMATFSPMMRTHSPERPEPYLSDYTDVFNDVKRFINMRYSYLPYTYTLAWENATKGTPLARPVNFHDTADLPASPAGCRDQYLWGRDILVAPVVTEENQRSITFPQGTWIDLNDMSKKYNGGTTIQYDAPLGVLPHFGRAGAFIPRFTQDSYTSTSEIDHTRLTVTYLATPRDAADTTPDSFTMFDDDRVSTQTLERKEYLTTLFKGEPTADGLAITMSHEGSYATMPTRRTVTFIIPGYTQPVKNVTVAGTIVPQAGNLDSFNSSDADSYILSEDHTLYIRTNVATTGETVVAVSSDKDNGIEMAGEDTDEAVTIEYSGATGMISYAIPTGSTATALTITGVNGSVINSYSGLKADSAINQLSTGNLCPGLYLACLTVCLPSGCKVVSRTVKMTVL